MSELTNNILNKVKSLFLIPEEATSVELDQKLSELAENREQANGLMAELATQIEQTLSASLESVSKQVSDLTESLNSSVKTLQDENEALRKENASLVKSVDELKVSSEKLKTDIAEEINVLKTKEVPGENSKEINASAKGKRDKLPSLTFSEVRNRVDVD